MAVVRRACMQGWLMAALAAGSAAAGADEQQGMAPLQQRIQGIDHTLDGMLEQMQHGGSTGYWRVLSKRPESEADGGASPLGGAQRGGGLTRQELQVELAGMDGKFEMLVTNLDATLSSSSGSTSYWQRHSPKTLPAPGGPVNMVAEAQTCIGDAKCAVNLAAVQMGNVNKGAFAVQLVASHLDAAEEKLECALRRLSKLGADPGSSDYWHSGQESATSDGGALLTAWILGGFLVAASVALLTELQKKAQAQQPAAEKGPEGQLTESLL